MALTFRTDKGSALSIQELDNNFRHFTGSHTISGSLTLDQGGVSATLSPQDIIDLRLGKSIVNTGNARGGDSSYMQASKIFDVNDQSTFIDLNDINNNFTITYQNSNVFNISSNPTIPNANIIEALK